MNYIFKPIIITLLVSLCPVASRAVVAMRGVRQVTQPDGTVLNIQKIGDEHRHLTLTEDGYVLYEKDGLFTYATTDADGYRISTGVPARNADMRSATDLAVAEDLAGFVERREASVKGSIRPRKTPQSGMGMADKSFPVRGEVRSIVILVEYSDVKFTLENAARYFTDMLTKPGFSEYGGTGSALDYFTENSSGVFTPRFDVYGPITLKNPRSYYGANDRFTDEDMHPEDMVIEACQQLDSIVDFSLYDTNGDRLIDNIFIFYAGTGEASYGPAESVWPHSWDVRATGKRYTFDGVVLATYGCTNEWLYRRPDGVGTFIHEFSHVMGLPDLYDTSYNLNCTPGSWSALDSGPYNNNGCTPPNYGAYERNALGWADARVLDGPADITLQPIDRNDFALIPTERDTEFFLLENRQQTGWDKYLPGHGMLIWHIDYSNPRVFLNNEVNNTRSHQYVDIIEANGNANCNSVAIERGYTFPGITGKTSFTAMTTPALISWSGRSIDLPLTDIAESEDGLITFKVSGGDTGVDDVTVDGSSEAEAVYYNLQGVRLDGPVPGELMIRVSGDSISKVRIKR